MNSKKILSVGASIIYEADKRIGLSRIGTTSWNDVEKYGKYRFFGKIIEVKRSFGHYYYVVKTKYCFPHMKRPVKCHSNVHSYQIVQVL